MKRVSFFDVVGSSDPKSANERPSRLQTRRQEDDRAQPDDFFDICESRKEEPSAPVTMEPDAEVEEFSFKFDDESTHGTLSSDHLIGRTRSREVPRMRKERRMRHAFSEHDEPTPQTRSETPSKPTRPAPEIHIAPPTPTPAPQQTHLEDQAERAIEEPTSEDRPSTPASREQEPVMRIRAASDRPADRTPVADPQSVRAASRAAEEAQPVEPDILDLGALEDALESKISSVTSAGGTEDPDDDEWDPFEDFEVKLQKI